MGEKLLKLNTNLKEKKQGYYCQSSIATEQLCFSEDSYLYLVLEFFKILCDKLNRNKGLVLLTEWKYAHITFGIYVPHFNVIM